LCDTTEEGVLADAEVAVDEEVGIVVRGGVAPRECDDVV